TLSFWAWPTVTPATSVRRFFMGAFLRAEMSAADARRQPSEQGLVHIAAIRCLAGLPCRLIHTVSIFAAFLAGLVSFLSPCVLPLVPPYLVYLAGATIEHIETGEAP